MMRTSGPMGIFFAGLHGAGPATSGRSRADRDRVGEDPMYFAADLDRGLAYMKPEQAGTNPSRTKRSPKRCRPARTLDRSQTWRVLAGRNGSLQAPYSAILDWSRTQVDRSRRAVTTCPSRKEREPYTRRTWTGAGPETELSSQTGPASEPDGASPSRAEREPSSPMRDGPGSEQDSQRWARTGQTMSESD